MCCPSYGAALAFATASLADILRVAGEPAAAQRMRPARGWERVTPTELRVVGFMVEGPANTEIGKRMFISRDNGH